jgi:hypothetical protein
MITISVFFSLCRHIIAFSKLWYMLLVFAPSAIFLSLSFSAQGKHILIDSRIRLFGIIFEKVFCKEKDKGQ